VVVGGVVPNGAFTTYWYEYGASASLGIKSTQQNIGSGYAELAAPAYITQLAKDTTYYFRLVAQNTLGKSTGATYTFRTTVGTPAPVGGIPTAKTLAATSLSRTAANINGEVTPNRASTQYWFEYGDTANLGTVSTVQSVGDGTAKVPVSLSLSNLAPATTYHFRLNAQNQFGTVNGAILTFKTPGPPLSVVPVVTTLVAGPVATTTATLRGTVNPYSSQTTYWFEYSTDSSFASSLKTTPKRSAGGAAVTVSVEANVSALASKTTYYYRTVAENAAGIVRGETISFKTN
jgi:phosphodiesterase/alkaline phosphatase D-like protein